MSFKSPPQQVRFLMSPSSRFPFHRRAASHNVNVMRQVSTGSNVTVSDTLPMTSWYRSGFETSSSPIQVIRSSVQPVSPPHVMSSPQTVLRYPSIAHTTFSPVQYPPRTLSPANVSHTAAGYSLSGPGHATRRPLARGSTFDELTIENLYHLPGRTRLEQSRQSIVSGLRNQISALEGLGLANIVDRETLALKRGLHLPARPHDLRARCDRIQATHLSTYKVVEPSAAIDPLLRHRPSYVPSMTTYYRPATYALPPADSNYRPASVQYRPANVQYRHSVSATPTHQMASSPLARLASTTRSATELRVPQIQPFGAFTPVTASSPVSMSPMSTTPISRSPIVRSPMLRSRTPTSMTARPSVTYKATRPAINTAPTVPMRMVLSSPRSATLPSIKVSGPSGEAYASRLPMTSLPASPVNPVVFHPPPTSPVLINFPLLASTNAYPDRHSFAQPVTLPTANFFPHLVTHSGPHEMRQPLTIPKAVAQPEERDDISSSSSSSEADLEMSSQGLPSSEVPAIVPLDEENHRPNYLQPARDMSASTMAILDKSISQRPINYAALIS